MTEHLGAEAAKQFFARVGRQQGADQFAKLAEERGQENQANQQGKQTRFRACHSLRQQGPQKPGQGTAIDDAVESNLQRQRSQQSQRRRQQTEQE